MEDFVKMLEQLKEAQEKAQEVQEKLTNVRATGEAGAGAVSATVNGHKTLLTLHIDPEYINAQEKKMLEDLIIAAVNLAEKAVTEKIEKEVRQHAEGILSDLSDDLTT